jgi:hypothetical protein
MPAAWLNRRHAMCDVPPTPPNACLTSAPFCFAQTMNSFMSLAGMLLLIDSAAGALADIPIGSKSLFESYFRFG